MKKSHSQPVIARMERAQLKKVLGVSDLFAVGYGDLGSSIYYALGITALYALGATPIALALAGLVFICTALTYSEMTSMFHESGGSASFARHAFNDLISFIAGWGLLLDYIVTIAISAFAVGTYLSYFFEILDRKDILMGFTVGIIGILLLINIIGVRQSTRMSLAIAVFTIFTQVMIIVIGAVMLLDIPYIVDHLRIGVANVDWSPSWPQFWKGTAMAMVAYTGIESIAQLGAESKKPSKTTPRAVFITMLVLIIIYMGLAVVALSGMTPQELATDYLENPIEGIVAALPFGSKILTPWVAILAGAILFSAANAGMVGASRLAFNMGEYYQLPSFFYRLAPNFRTPYISLAFFAIFSALVVLASRGHLTFLADLYNFGAMLAFFFAHLSVIVLRIKKPHQERPFRIGMNIKIGKHHLPISAIIGCIATFSVWVLIVITKPEGRNVGFAWMTLGILMYVLYRKRQKIAPMGKLSIERIKIPDFKPLLIKKILVPTRGGTQTETVQMACEIAKIHDAKITAVHVIEVPPSIPLDSEMKIHVLAADAVLRRTEAIAREMGVDIDIKIIRSRSVIDTILQLLEQDKYDLLVLGAMQEGKEKYRGIGSVADQIIRRATCKIWVCGSDAKNHHL